MTQGIAYTGQLCRTNISTDHVPGCFLTDTPDAADANTPVGTSSTRRKWAVHQKQAASFWAIILYMHCKTK